jgi:hypothetical protein
MIKNRASAAADGRRVCGLHVKVGRRTMTITCTTTGGNTMNTDMNEMLRYFEEINLTGMSDAERKLSKRLATTLVADYQSFNERLQRIEAQLQVRA